MRALSRVTRTISRISLSSETITLKQEIPAIFVERAREAATLHRVAVFCFAPALATSRCDFRPPHMVGMVITFFSFWICSGFVVQL
jgi:hypothetical protein